MIDAFSMFPHHVTHLKLANTREVQCGTKNWRVRYILMSSYITCKRCRAKWKKMGEARAKKQKQRRSDANR